MSERSWAAAAVAVILAAGAGPAFPADLSGRDSPYAPPYSESDRAPPPPRYGQPPPEAYRPAPPPRAHGPVYPDWRYDRYAERCVPRALIHEQLRRQGWRSVVEFGFEDRFIFVRVHDWNGAAFDLRLDRCNGRVLEQRFVEVHPYDFAWRHRRGYRAY